MEPEGKMDHRAGDALWKDHIKPAFSGDWDLLAIILVLALALRIYFAIIFKGNLTLGFAPGYAQAARTGVIGTAEGPLYALLLRAVYALAGQASPTVVFILQGILSAAGLLLVYFIAARICGRRAGLTAAAIGAIYPDLILYNLSQTPVSIEIFLVLLVTAICISRIGERFSSLLASIALSVGILFDPLMVFLAPGTLMAVRRKGIFLAALVILLVPWTIRNSVKASRPVAVYTPVAYRLDLSKFKAGSLDGRWQLARRLTDNASALMGKGWAMTADSSSGGARNSTYAAGYAYTLVMLAGFTGMARRIRKDHARAILPSAAAIILLMILTIFSQSYRTLIEPLFVIYAGTLAGGCRR